MRVLVLAGAYPSPAHPAYGSYVARAAEALRADGIAVDVVALRTRARGTLATPLKYAALGLRGGLHGLRRPDVIWVHALAPPGAIAALVATPLRIPYVVTAHGSDVAAAERSERLGRLARRVVARAASVIAVSPDLAARLEALVGPLGDRLHVVSAGVDLARFAPGDRDVAAAALGWDAAGPRFVHLGNLVEVKNLERLLEAVAQVATAEDGAALALVGAGPLGESLRRRAATLGLEMRIRFAGEVPDGEAARWLRASHAACLVSLREGFGLAAVEALACGRPVAISRTAGAAVAVEPGVTGALCDPLDVGSIASALETAAALEPGVSALEAAAPYELGRETARVAAILAAAAAPRRA